MNIHVLRSNNNRVSNGVVSRYVTRYAAKLNRDRYDENEGSVRVPPL
jgi:hypothetical protein